MAKVRWTRRWNRDVSERPKLPGVWELKDGGFLVRARVKTHAGTQVEILRALRVETALDAATELERLKADARRPPSSLSTPTATPRPLFADFAVSVLERRVALGDIASPATRMRWADVIEHMLVPAFGHLRVDELHVTHIKAWLVDLSENPQTVRRLKRGHAREGAGPDDYETRTVRYGKRTINTALAQLKVICAEAMEDYDLGRDPAAKVEPLDLTLHPVYVDEDPNSLTREELRAFLELARVKFPQHFAMMVLGFCTGLRPSSLRPLRRSGASPDIIWETGELKIRRSHTIGDEVMGKTKTGHAQKLLLPKDVVVILTWHVAGFTEVQARSDLLFPSTTGGFRSRTVLVKPFRALCEALGITKRFTARGMRRTFNDLARVAGLAGLVTRSISGHRTEAMQEHYSTVAADEQRAALVKIVTSAGVALEETA